EPYFATNAAGHIVVSPQGDRGGTLDLYDLVEGLRQRNLSLPLLVRFPDILADRLERLQACFNRAIARYGYGSTYQGVYPIKCNQNRQSVEALVAAGRAHRFGLEAGSKSELTIALALLDTPGALLICNGYKDREYIETALLATQLGHCSLLAIEQLSELHLALETSHKLGIRPVLGLRAKLSTQGSGRWGASTGDRAKFGLTARQILQAIDMLRAADCLDCLKLLHFHIGSQISAIGVIKDALREAAQLYVELHKLGANLQYLDVGGGLAVDYDGSKTNSSASKNYNMQNYANDIVAAVRDACRQGDVPTPILVSETGRAISAHQAILICDVLGGSGPATEFPPHAVKESAPD
ncbi:MAG: biosynthetic arginine decarboxylase, partial [Cyanobacteria bacterium J06641_5]